MRQVRSRSARGLQSNRYSVCRHLLRVAGGVFGISGADQIFSTTLHSLHLSVLPNVGTIVSSGNWSKGGSDVLRS